MGNGQIKSSQVIIEYEKVLSRILHDVLTQVLDEKAYGSRSAIPVSNWEVERMAALVSKEHLESTPMEVMCVSHCHPQLITHTPLFLHVG